MSEEEKAIEKLKEAQERMIKPKMLKDVKFTNEDYSKAIEIILNQLDNQQKEIEEKNIAINKMSKDISHQLKEIEEKSTIINQLLEDMKERANNFSYESEIMWRKIEKAEELLQENIKEENS